MSKIKNKLSRFGLVGASSIGAQLFAYICSAMLLVVCTAILNSQPMFGQTTLSNVKSQFQSGEFREPYSSPVTWIVETDALSGFPNAVKRTFLDYIESAITLLDGRGQVPSYQQIIYANEPEVDLTAIRRIVAGQYPLDVQFADLQSTACRIHLLPKPDLVRKLVGPAPDIDHIALMDRVPPQFRDWRSYIRCHLYYDVFDNPSKQPDDQLRRPGGSAVIVPAQRGFAHFAIKVGDKTIDNPYSVSNGRRYTSLSPDTIIEYFKVPNRIGFESRREVELTGIIGTLPAHPDNHRIWWTFSKDLNARTTSVWLSYELYDANGPFNEMRGTNPYLNSGSFRIPLIAPWEPRFANNGSPHQRPMNRAEELLCNPLPVQFALSKEEMCESWTMCEAFYSEHPLPVWVVQTEIYSEIPLPRYHLRNASQAFDQGESENWNKNTKGVFIFSNVLPHDLIEVLCAIKGVGSDHRPSKTEIDSTVVPKWRAFEDACNDFMSAKRQ